MHIKNKNCDTNGQCVTCYYTSCIYYIMFKSVFPQYLQTFIIYLQQDHSKILSSSSLKYVVHYNLPSTCFMAKHQHSCFSLTNLIHSASLHLVPTCPVSGTHRSPLSSTVLHSRSTHWSFCNPRDVLLVRSGVRILLSLFQV